MAQRITHQQLEAYLWGAAVLLRGTIDAGDYRQFIFPLLFYKRLCDVFDEGTQTALAESICSRCPAYRDSYRSDASKTPHVCPSDAPTPAAPCDSSGLRDAVLTVTSGFRGSSYGSCSPVRSLISPS